MIIAVVGFILKVIGNKSATPAAAPIPGIAPTMIPKKPPTKVMRILLIVNIF